MAAAAGGDGSVPGARLLDASRDADHHRSVLTLAGDGDGLVAALLGLYGVAEREIDLRRHRGAHPRVGAVDVVPFVPLGETPMARAVAAAHSLAARVAERHGVPVILYGEAATAPHRRQLADLRRGGVEALAGRLASAAWAPDYGPARPHPSLGVSLVGARFFLVAANAWLDTGDVEVARKVARAVRESSGGLPAVRALGLFMGGQGGRAQVSMNLVDYRLTSPARAFAAVAREAAAHGAAVERRELIGLLPAAALAAPDGNGVPTAQRPAVEAEAARLAELWGGRTLERALAQDSWGGAD